VYDTDVLAISSSNRKSRPTWKLNSGTGRKLEAGTFFSGFIDDVRIYDRALIP
jgi:hypothetical protein